jgi:hypothetical protein
MKNVWKFFHEYTQIMSFPHGLSYYEMNRSHQDINSQFERL